MKLINQQIQGYKLRLESLIGQLHDLTVRVQHEEMSDLSLETKNSIGDPFMFVIVGEVKVGKSSFINALLDSKEEICKVAPHPMTDTIQVIRHGTEITEKSVNPFLKELTHPADILKEVSVVDTPGTNTIVEQHQEITEEFIPNSDLVVFVFEAKNPYRQSAWDLFKYIQKDWHKKLLFVLQQKDLMSSADLATNVQGVKDYAHKQGVEDPRVYTVSALQELEGKHAESGFGELREYIEQTITGGKAPVLKLLSKINIANQIIQRLEAGLEDRKKQWESDMRFRTDIEETLDEHQNLSKKQIESLVTNILDSYDATTLRVRSELSSGLGFFTILKKSIGAIFDKDQNPKNWLEKQARELEHNLNDNLRNRLGGGVRDISESLQQMAQIAQLKIQSSETILKNDHDVFHRIADKRARILEELQEAFDEFLRKTDNFYPEDMLKGGERLSPNVATGTGIAVLGAMLTALTNGVVFDVTGGVLTAIGLIFAGASLGFQKRRILRRYTDEVAKGRRKLDEQVTVKLNDYVQHIREKIDQTFDKFDVHLKQEEVDIADIKNQQQSLSQNIHSVQNDITNQTGITL